MSKITKQEFFDTLNFLINNKEKIDKNTFHFREDYKKELYLTPLGIPLFLFISYLSFPIFNYIDTLEKNSFGILFLMVVGYFLFSCFGAIFLNDKISQLILKNNTKRDDYSLLSIFRKKTKKDKNERISKIKNFHHFIKNSLSKNIIKNFQTLKYSNILSISEFNKNQYSPAEYLIESLKNIYAEQHSEDIAWQHFSEYFFNNHQINDSKIQKYIHNIENHYSSKNNDLEKKQMLASAAGLADNSKNKNINNELSIEINQKNKLGILKI